MFTGGSAFYGKIGLLKGRLEDTEIELKKDDWHVSK